MRNSSIDTLRFIGALSIIWFHLGLPRASYALSALEMFVILLVYFSRERSVGERAERLMVPWVIWCGIFGVAKCVDAISRGAPISSEFELWMLLTGPAVHLWFLPFCFLFLLTFGRIDRTFLLYIAVPLALAGFALCNLLDLPVPFVQWSSVLASALLGLVMQHSVRWAFWGVGFAAMGFALYAIGWATGTLQLGIGAILVVLALALPFSETRVTTVLASLSLGIYLIHPLINAMLLRLGDFGPEVRFVLVALGSVLGTMALQRTVPRAV